MGSSVPWQDVLDELEANGMPARVVPVERLAEARARAEAAMAESGFADGVAERIVADFAGEAEGAPRPARSVVVTAVARPLTQAGLTWRGETRTVVVPPHYAGYHAVPRAMAAKVNELLRPLGFAGAFHEPPLKTLATYSGLARYGRNNIAYVPGLGSWLQLGACVTDAPPPDDAAWGEPQVLDRCAGCTACQRTCPTGAIAGDRFVLHTDQCLTWHNESEDPFPDWLDASAHHCAVGCLRCQQACPENARVELVHATPEWFDEEETEAILAAGEVASTTREKLARCGLDYSPTLIARNVRLLLGGSRPGLWRVGNVPSRLFGGGIRRNG